MLPNYDNSLAPLPSGRAASNRSCPMRMQPSEKSLITAPIDLNVQVANLLAQRVPIETEQIGGADLVAPGRRQSGREQRHLDLLEDAVIEAGRRHTVWKTGKMRRQI